MNRVPKCFKCLSEGLYNELVDAYMCRPCNHWLETVCSDKQCKFCNKRLTTPELSFDPLDGFAQMD